MVFNVYISQLHQLRLCSKDGFCCQQPYRKVFVIKLRNLQNISEINMLEVEQTLLMLSKPKEQLLENTFADVTACHKLVFLSKPDEKLLSPLLLINLITGFHHSAADGLISSAVRLQQTNI